ncbi:MAG: GatB/YqeY domain-containing protein, partial [Nitrospirota bacterium]|nr:GatB/YqeY domain-containing protein [Nitrospirota bacterium]
KDMGKVMRLLMPRVKGVADGNVVNQRVKELLDKT